MTSESFYEYITNVFHPWVVKNNVPLPVILFLDEHSSHINLPLTKFCRDKGIILTALLPNSTHRLQPLDVAVFHPLKNTWRNQVQRWRVDNNGERLRREDFAKQVDKCISEAVTVNIIKNGFRSCGLYPFNPDNIDYSKLLTEIKTISQESNIQNDTRTTANNSNSNNLVFEIEKRLCIETLRQFRNNGNK